MIDANATWIDLPEEGVLAVRGADARKFLNGQLSQQLLTLGPAETTLAGLHNPQGRTIALLRIVADGPQDLLCVLPQSLLEGVLALLRKYLLRSKAVLSNESSLWRVQGRWPAAGAAKTATPLSWPHTGDGRWMRLAPADSPPSSELAVWHRADIAAGLPRIYPATQSEFVAQMLNLDVLGGISFNKGCYTGQEVIARAHFRGRVKRRLQRFAVPAEAIDKATFVPGAGIVLADGREATLVDCAAAHEGRVEFLAVARYDAAPSDSPGLPTISLPLPYELPVAE